MNPRSLFSSVVLTTSLYAIVAYMNAEKLNINDISLVDVCFKAAEKGSVENDTCQLFEERKMTWWTKEPCIEGFDEENFFYTPAQFLGVDQISRKTKGDDAKEVVDTMNTYERPELCKPTDEQVASFSAMNADKSDDEKRSLFWRQLGSNWYACGTKKSCRERFDLGNTNCLANDDANLFFNGNRWILNNGCINHDACIYVEKGIKRNGCNVNHCDWQLHKQALQCWNTGGCEGKYFAVKVATLFKFTINWGGDYKCDRQWSSWGNWGPNSWPWRDTWGTQPKAPPPRRRRRW